MLTSIRWFLNKSVNEVFVSKVNTAHQTKLEELKAEISEVDRKSSENCVVSFSPFSQYNWLTLSYYFQLWRPFLSDFYVESLVSIGFSCQSCQMELGKQILDLHNGHNWAKKA